jgi:uncharacterized protein YjbJ (UPF0337 family)
MNQDQLQGKWHQMKGEIRSKWGRLTNDDIDQINGNTEKLLGVLQERYGYNREQAEKEFKEFSKDPAGVKY